MGTDDPTGTEAARFDWTDARVAELRGLQEEGLSMAQIAAQMGCGLTRNAVIGKVHRLGIQHGTPRSVRPTVAPEPGVERVRRKSPALRAARPPMPSVEPELAHDREPFSLLFSESPAAKAMVPLTVGRCPYPIGDPRMDGFRFCCALASERRPYCEAHAAEAFQHPSSRMRRAPQSKQRIGVPA